jgi:hypothetical protein
MGKAIPTQNPAVVLRSQFNWLRALLAIALVAIAGLGATLVIVASDESSDTSAGSPAMFQRSAPATFDPNSIKSAPGDRYDGGPEEGTRGAGH